MSARRVAQAEGHAQLPLGLIPMATENKAGVPFYIYSTVVHNNSNDDSSTTVNIIVMIVLASRSCSDGTVTCTRYHLGRHRHRPCRSLLLSLLIGVGHTAAACSLTSTQFQLITTTPSSTGVIDGHRSANTANFMCTKMVSSPTAREAMAASSGLADLAAVLSLEASAQGFEKHTVRTRAM